MPFICDASNKTCSCNPDTDTYFQYGQGCLSSKYACVECVSSLSQENNNFNRTTKYSYSRVMI